MERRLLQRRPVQMGMAVKTGELEKSSTWETETTTILLRLTGDNHKFSFEIRYTTRNEELLTRYQQLEDQSLQNAL